MDGDTGSTAAARAEPTQRKHWSEAMKIIPEGWGEREDKPRSTRWPKAIMKRVEAVAKETGHDYTTALFHLIKWALDEYERQRAAERSQGAAAKGS